MEIKLNSKRKFTWQLQKIAVIGPGIVGMPMAALLANAKIKIGTSKPANVVVIQRNSENSGWKVDAINSGQSVIGGIEPGLDNIVKKCVAEGILYASHDYKHLADADMILVCVQTDKKGLEPDYGPLFGALTSVALALQHKPIDKVPLVVFESTLAPSSMHTVIRDHFEKYNLIEGEDILLGNSPNRVMPGRLVERVTESDKLVAGLHPETPRMIRAVYKHIVTKGNLFETNSLTAEITKTLENAYRDVRIAYSTEIVRYCDDQDIDFYRVRNLVNKNMSQEDNASHDPNAVPSGGLLIPMVGVGGHCLPKDGILLWWRKIEFGADTSDSLILQSRVINNEAPANTIELIEKKYGDIHGKTITVLGTAYRFNSEDTRNSPSIQLALLLKEKGCNVRLHDPYVKKGDQNLLKYDVDNLFTNNISRAVDGADILIFATAHKSYLENAKGIFSTSSNLKLVADACNLYRRDFVEKQGYEYVGIGRGKKIPDTRFIHFVMEGFQAMERGLANELEGLISFLNDRFVSDDFNKVSFEEVQNLAASCNTGCIIAYPGPVNKLPTYNSFHSRLAKCAVGKLSIAD